jgi:hypothetical protein
MNGWFLGKPDDNWPPSPDIEPLFISFHITESAVRKLTSQESINYFKKYEPIGCRDLYTMNLLKNKGVDAYFSGCLTLTLKNKVASRSDKILIVDVPKEMLDCIPTSLIKKSEISSQYAYLSLAKKTRIFFRDYRGHIYTHIKNLNCLQIFKKVFEGISKKIYVACQLSTQKKLELAEERLNDMATAKLVITSRLHCVLPCIAFKTPVISLRANPDDPRYKGLLQYINHYTYEEFRKKSKEIDWEGIFENPGNPEQLQKKMITTCKNFISK